MTVPLMTETRLLPPGEGRPPVAPPGAVRRTVRRLVRPRRAWTRVLRAGLLLWVLATVATELTANPTLVPAVIMLGSFLVPVTCVVAAWEHRHAEAGNAATAVLVARCAVPGGAYAVVLAAVAERLLLHRAPAVYLGVGVIEETAKLAALLWCTRRMRHRTLREGLVLGAAVGFGFAALESAGYAFRALFTPAGLSFDALVGTEVLRALLAPFGHGLWTAVLGAAWFAAFPRPLWGRLRRHRAPLAAPARVARRWPAVVTAVAAWAYVVLLHAAFDDMPSLVTSVTGTADPLVHLAGMALVTALGLLGLLVARAFARRQEAAAFVFTARLLTMTSGRGHREGARS